jgi:hypothetical protein
MAIVIGEHAPSQTEGDVHAHGLYELRCDADGWSDDARSCLATINSDDEADGCIAGCSTAISSAGSPPTAPGSPPIATTLTNSPELITTSRSIHSARCARGGKRRDADQGACP